jgi:hypothetical protein
MKVHIPATQVFALVAIAVALLISYVPPQVNGAALFGLVNFFLGHLISRMFPEIGIITQKPVAPAASDLPQQVLPSKPTGD